jgi:hypothetical protein
MDADVDPSSPPLPRGVQSPAREPLQRRCTRRAATALNRSETGAFVNTPCADRRARQSAAASSRRQPADTPTGMQAVRGAHTVEQSGSWQLVTRGGCCRQCGLMGERQWHIRGSGDDLHMLCERCFGLRDLYVGKRLDAMAQLGQPLVPILARASPPAGAKPRAKARSKRARMVASERASEAKTATYGDDGAGGESTSRLRLTEMADHVRAPPPHTCMPSAASVREPVGVGG